jgi:hypothetical protein
LTLVSQGYQARAFKPTSEEIAKSPSIQRRASKSGEGTIDEPEIRLKRAEIFDTKKEFQFGLSTVNFRFSNDSLVYDGSEFSLDLYFNLSDPHASWDVCNGPQKLDSHLR